jgi:putrescine---pyruvate transaminase
LVLTLSDAGSTLIKSITTTEEPSMTPSHLWHGFTDMSVTKTAQPFVVARGEGPYLFDAEGRRYLDASAGLWFCNIGHGRTEVAQAASRQLATLAAYSTFGDYTNGPAEELADWLADHSPTDGAAVLFSSGGSDSVDSAIKLVRRFWAVTGHPERRVIVSRELAYHGGHMGSTGVGGIAVDRDGFGELISDTVRIPWDSSEALETLIADEGAHRIAAFIAEPIIAAGGVWFPPEGYLQRVAEICAANDVIFIADEVVTGFGRAGDWFATKRFGIQPDVVVCAKGLTSGYAALGALIAGSRVSEPFYNGSAGALNHGYTYAGHPGGAAVALANIAILERERLADNVLELVEILPSSFVALEEHPLVSSVRTGPALMAAVELSSDATAAHPGLPQAVARAMRDAGVLTRALVGGEIQFSPPLLIDPQQVKEFTDAVLYALGSATDDRS